MNQEYERYKADKLIDYLKYISTIHLGIIGITVTFKEKFLSGAQIEMAFWITIFVLCVSFVMATYGYIVLINSYFENIRHHVKIISFARKWPGYILVGVLVSFVIQAASI